VEWIGAFAAWGGWRMILALRYGFAAAGWLLR